MRMKKARAAAAALLCAACLAQTAVPALAAEAYTAPDVTGKTLEQLMDDFRAEHALTGDNFEISFYVPETGEQYDFNETKMLYGASTYKLPLNLYYYDMQLAGEITGDTMTRRASFAGRGALSVAGLFQQRAFVFPLAAHRRLAGIQDGHAQIFHHDRRRDPAELLL